MSKLLTPEELAVHLNLYTRDGAPNIAYIWRKCRDGSWPHIRLPGSRLIRFDSEEINRVLFGFFGGEGTGKQKPAVNRSLAFKRISGKRAVGSIERKDLLWSSAD